MENIVEDVEGVDLSKIPELELRAKEVRVRSMYASILRHYGQTFQYTWYKDFRIDMAIIVCIIRYTSSHGLVDGPDQFDLYKFKSTMLNWWIIHGEVRKLVPELAERLTPTSIEGSFVDDFTYPTSIYRRSMIGPNFRFLRGKFEMREI